MLKYNKVKELVEEYLAKEFEGKEVLVKEYLEEGYYGDGEGYFNLFIKKGVIDYKEIREDVSLYIEIREEG